jgi:ankyrin repeat protein
VRTKPAVGCGVFLLAVAALVFTIDSMLTGRLLSRRPPLTAAERAFFTAARKGDVAGIKQGLVNGVDVNAVEPAYRRTALMRAAAFDHREAVQVLLAAGANPHVTDADQYTALHIAAEANAVRVIPLIPATPADHHALCLNRHGGSTPLGLAVRTGHVEAVRALLANHGDPAFVEPSDQSLLEQAVDDGRTEIVTALLAAHAPLTPSGHGPLGPSSSILHIAVRRCDRAKLEIVKALVEAGADLTFKDASGHTAREAIEAAEPKYVDVSCYPPILEYLKSKEATR